MVMTNRAFTELPRNFDGSKECWHCRGKNMQPQRTHWKCSFCGATWNSVTIGEMALIPGGEGAKERRRFGY